jgi:heme exporter protein C
MNLFFSKKINVISAIVVFILMVFNIYNITSNTPMVPDQFWAQKIFYFHVPIAWTGFLSYLIVMIAGVLYLINKRTIWDHLGYAAAEIGTLFIVLVLITGPIWAKPIWGTWWTWEPRLTTTLILFLIYVGYFMLRKFGGHPERTSRYAAVLGIVAFFDVPIIFYSVRFWEERYQSHPQVEIAKQNPDIIIPFLISLIIFSILFSFMLKYRLHVLKVALNRKKN